MSEIVYCIPTYKREKLPTLDILRAAGVDRDRILVSTQTEEDFATICDRYFQYCIPLYREGKCVGDNRNRLMEYCEQEGYDKIIMLDDDIKSIDIMSGKKNRPLTSQELEPTFAYCFAQAKRNNAPLWGVYPVNNAFFQRARTLRRSILIGTVMGITDNTLRYDETFRIKEDYELCCRVMAQGCNCLRFDVLSANAAHKSKGGCECDWNKTSRRIYAHLLAERYPELIGLSNKPGEVKFKLTLESI